LNNKQREESGSNKKNKNKEENYEMMGIEDESKHNNQSISTSANSINNSHLSNLHLINLDDIDHLESRLTSVSSKKDGKLVSGSLSTVLSQALTSDDTETIDWILKQKD
jgi:hypothetical protein